VSPLSLLLPITISLGVLSGMFEDQIGLRYLLIGTWVLTLVFYGSARYAAIQDHAGDY
jgi:hypothetical protein